MGFFTEISRDNRWFADRGFWTRSRFYKVNNRPFIDVITNMVSYSSQPHLYLWKKVERKKATSAQQTLPAKIPGINLPKTGKSRLDDLAWSLDVKEEFKNRN